MDRQDARGACSQCWVILALVSVLLSSADARAHGGPPETMGIVAADAEGRPRVVLLNEGLAVNLGMRWTFLCPSAWGQGDTATRAIPLAMSVDGIDSWVIGSDDLYLARDGMLSAQGQPALARSSVVALAGDQGAVVGLRIEANGTALVRIDDGSLSPRFESPEFWSTFAIDSATGRTYLARETGTTLVVLVIDRDGQPVETFEAALHVPLARSWLRPTPRGLYAIAFDGQYYILAKLDPAGTAEVLAETPIPIAGPQAAPDGSLWVAIDGELMRDAGDGFESVKEPRRVTCLGQWRSTAYACAGAELYRLTDEGVGERLFTLDGISSPAPALIPEAAKHTCELQWQLFRYDLSQIGLSAVTFEDESSDGHTPSSTDAALGASATDMRAASAGEAMPSDAALGAPETRMQAANAGGAMPSGTGVSAPAPVPPAPGVRSNGGSGGGCTSTAGPSRTGGGGLAIALLLALLRRRILQRHQT